MDALAHSTIAPLVTGEPVLDSAHVQMRTMHGAMLAAKAQRQPDGVLRMTAELYVEAAHEYQRLRYGRVRQRLSVGYVLRALA